MRRPLYGIHPVSPRQHLEDYSKTRDMRERKKDSAYAVFAWCSIALAAWGLYQVVAVVVG